MTEQAPDLGHGVRSTLGSHHRYHGHPLEVGDTVRNETAHRARQSINPDRRHQHHGLEFPRVRSVVTDERPASQQRVGHAAQRAGPTGTLRCVADSLLRRRPLIRYDGPGPGKFEAVVLVSPIWIYRLAGPMRSFVADRVADLKRVAVVSVMGAQGASNAVAAVSYTHLRAHETDSYLVCRLL